MNIKEKVTPQGDYDDAEIPNPSFGELLLLRTEFRKRYPKTLYSGKANKAARELLVFQAYAVGRVFFEPWEVSVWRKSHA